MKKGIFTFLFTLAVAFGYSQTTYYWQGGTTSTSFTTNSNWNTMLDGSGASRSATATNDILIFDGTNVGGTTPTVGPVSIAFTGTIVFRRLILQNGADVAFARNSTTGTTTMTIGDTSTNCLTVHALCKLRIKGVTGSISIVIASNAGTNNSPAATQSSSALIYGDIIMEEGSSAAQNRFTSRMKNAFVFSSGSSFTTNSTYNFSPFSTSGSSTTPFNNGVVFETGSSYFYNSGLSPFGNNSSSNLVDFQPGSNFYFRAPASTNMFNGRKYANVFVQNNATVVADGSPVRIDDLVIVGGSTLVTDSSGATPIFGNILNDGTLMVPATNPNRTNKLVMVNSAAQSIGGSGTYTLGHLIVSNVSNVTLNKSINVDTLIKVIGTFNPNGKAITGSGTTVIKSSVTLPPVTANINIDSVLVKNVSDFTGVEIGMQVSGTNIPANTVIVNLSSTNGTITLSKPATGGTYAGSTGLTIFNGTGVVLPIKFGAISASLLNNVAKVTWNILLEENIKHYVIERSATGNNFLEVGVVAASRFSQYSFTDASPMNGTNLYRIKAISFDGEFKYSSIVKVSLGKAAQLQVYPNPVKDVLSVSGIQFNDKIRVVDMKGNIVINQQTVSGSNALSIDVSNLPKGNYILEVTGENGSQTKSFIKL